MELLLWNYFSLQTIDANQRPRPAQDYGEELQRRVQNKAWREIPAL